MGIDRRTDPEVGGIVHLEHFNFEVPDHDLATVFFMGGLGLTRDPYKRTDHLNMGVNIGLQQFHLPRRGNAPPPFDGEVGLIIPDLDAIKTRLERIAWAGHFDGTPYAYEGLGDTALVTSPFGVRLRLHSPGVLPFTGPLGLAYIDIPAPPGTAGGIAAFYRELLAAPAEVTAIQGEAAAVVTFGPHQTLNFRERQLDDYDLFSHHVCLYVTGFNAVRREMEKRNLTGGSGDRDDAFFFTAIADPGSNEVLLGLNHETRSLHHPDFMRPLVNRWPLESEPFSDQAEIQADRTRTDG